MEILAAIGRILVPAFCPACGAAALRPDLCGACRVALGPPGFFRRLRGPPTLGLWAGVPYRGPGGALVRAMKYRRYRSVAPVAAEWVLAALVAARREGDLAGEGWEIWPVPASPRRGRERGYDSVAYLANFVGGRAGLPVRRGIVRARETPPQAGLARALRAENVRGAFRPARECSRHSWAPRVLLLDDVATSGATLLAAAEAARTAGAREILAVVAAASFFPLTPPPVG